MVTVDLRRKLQAEKCSESGDLRAHLNKLQAMREDLVSMGGSINDEDFTSIVLGSIPQSYDPYIAAITATSSLLDKTLSSTNLIDAIRDEADRRTIKNPKAKKDEQDAAFVAGQSTGKGKKGGEGSKNFKKNLKCYNCQKKGHLKKDCWAPGGGAEGKGPKGKGKGKEKEKEVAAKADDKGANDSDAIWMGLTYDNVVDEVIDNGITGWLNDCGGDSGSEYELWTEEEIAENKWDEEIRQVDIDYSPRSMISEANDTSSDISNFFLDTDTSSDTSVSVDSMPDLASVSDSSDGDVQETEGEVGSVERAEEDVEEALDLDDEPKTYTFVAATLANSVSSTLETELFDSGASRHMSPYRHKFINFFPIQKRVLTAADGGTFDAIGKGDMFITMPNGQTTTRILLKDVLYAPKMGVTLVSIGKIDVAGYASLFHKNCLRIFSC